MYLPFLALSYGDRDFIKSNISPYGDEIEVLHLNAALEEWSIITCNSNFPASPDKQKDWDTIYSKIIYESLLESLPSPADQAQLLAIRTKGIWPLA